MTPGAFVLADLDDSHPHRSLSTPIDPAFASSIKAPQHDGSEVARAGRVIASILGHGHASWLRSSLLIEVMQSHDRIIVPATFALVASALAGCGSGTSKHGTGTTSCGKDMVCEALVSLSQVPQGVYSVDARFERASG